LKALASSPGFQNAQSFAKFRDDAANNEPIRFIEALQRSSRSLSTEPRDKIFGLLGLTYDSGLFLPVPNYKQSVEAICKGMTISAISSMSSLNIVPLLGSGHGSQDSLPSWVADWFELDEFVASRRISHLLPPPKAKKGTEQPSVSIDNDVLRVKVVVINTPTIGATTTVAVFFHEIPHEVGDFALLIQSGFSKRAAMGAQFVTALGALLGTVIGIVVQEYGGGADTIGMGMRSGLWGTSLSWGNMLLPFTAGTFLYVGTVAVIPELLETGPKRGEELRKTGMQFMAMAAGAGIML
jgi:hypothetical protein